MIPPLHENASNEAGCIPLDRYIVDRDCSPNAACDLGRIANVVEGLTGVPIARRALPDALCGMNGLTCRGQPTNFKPYANGAAAICKS